MAEKPTYEELEQRVQELEQAEADCKRAEESLRESEEKFYIFFQNNPALMALSILPERRIIEVNDAFIKTLGYTRDEIIGRTSQELSLFVNSKQQAKVAKRLKTEGHTTNVELQVRSNLKVG